MTDLSALVETAAAILRADAALRALAPHWGAEDARAHVFVGPPPVGATNTGRAPYVILALEGGEHPATREGDRCCTTVTATILFRLVAKDDVGALAWRIHNAFVGGTNAYLGDPEHVIGVALERGKVERLGPCETTTLRLHVRLLAEAGT